MASFRTLINSFSQHFTRKRVRGQSLIELLLAFAFAGIVLPVLATAFVSSREGKAQQQQRTDAVAFMAETEEAMRSIRESGWSSIATNGIYHPVANVSVWTLASGAEPETVNGLVRQIQISDVYRDAEGKIVSTGGSLDYSTKKIVISVSWTQPSTSSLSRTSYFSRYLQNNAITQTLKPDFDAGVASGAVVVDTAGGEVVLGASGKANWCEPNLSLAAFDLPKSGVANAVSAVEGRVVAGTGDSSDGVSLANVSISNQDPPPASLAGTFDGYKTNGVFTEGHYAYLTTDTNSKELVIIDLDQQNPVTKKYAEVGSFNAPGNTDGVSIFVATGAATIGFLTTADNKFYTINLENRSNPTQLTSKTLAGKGTKVVVNGSYAFVSIAGATQEMQIIQFNSSGTTLTITGYADVNGQRAPDVSVNSTGSRAYIATGQDPSKREFFIIDTSSKSGNRPVIGSYEANGMDPRGVSVVTGNRAILVGASGEEYQVINIANEASPQRCGGLQISSGINGVSSVIEADTDAYSYIITGDASSELKIIEGGAGGTYAESGTFTSSIVDAGSTVVFNRLLANVDLPSQTNVQFQVAIALPVSGSCTNATYVFVGPDGTTGTYFPASGGVLPFDQNGTGYENPARCLQYRAYLTTNDINSTPVINDVSVNYSP